MPGKARKSLRGKTIQNVLRSNLSETDKKCIIEVFERYEQREKENEKAEIIVATDKIEEFSRN